jgi:hypothetical protein
MSEELLFGNLEDELMFSLNPVEPRREFVARLKHQLITPSDVKIEPPSRIHQFIPAVAGVMGGIIIIWVARRLFSYFSKRI